MVRIAAVTGASRGIGRATALALARSGFRVFALARSEMELRTLADEAMTATLDIVPVAMDVADEASRKRAVASIMDAVGAYGLDVLVNNAGYGQMGPMEEVAPELLRQQLEVNLVGLLAFTQPFIVGMRERGQGLIVNVSSVSARMVAPFSGAYAASKCALEAISDALRLELHSFGVHVVLIEPGPIRTNFHEVSQRLTPSTRSSAYAGLIHRFEEGRNGWYLFEQPPEAVARTIMKAVYAERPRARYTVTVPAKLTNLTRRFVPDFITDWTFQRMLARREQ